MSFNLVKEDGYKLLQENGGGFLLENFELDPFKSKEYAVYLPKRDFDIKLPKRDFTLKLPKRDFVIKTKI